MYYFCKSIKSCLLLCLCLITAALQAQSQDKITYTIRMKGPSMDTFYVEAKVPKLSKENNIYHFASTAPGTYSVLDFGRFVANFKAYNKKGKELPTRKLQTNQWEITRPDQVHTIRYMVAETFDTPVKEHQVAGMGGTSLEKDHALLNMSGLLGYFKGMQETDIAIQLDYPAGWEVGTAMLQDDKGYFLASDYDFAVDSPVLLGRLSKASTTIGQTRIDIYTYSKTDLVKSDTLLSAVQKTLQAASQFLKKLPVDRYVFLNHFEDNGWGALEHAYSSEYVLKEEPVTQELLAYYTEEFVAHEFFHVVTPLNIHSEIIEQFNFVTPTPSEHLWLYEGVTEWASHAMHMRAGVTTVEEFFKQMQEKLTIDKEDFDKNYSLSKLSLTCYTPEGNEQYDNIYYRGAVVAALLDIRLLELSGGKRGLRELILELTSRYGPKKAFPEKALFDILVEMTYPEIKDFITHYIRGTQSLPVDEYFAKIGYTCLPEQKTGEMELDFGHTTNFSDGKIKVVQVNDSLAKAGVQKGDEILNVNGIDIILENMPQIRPMIDSTKVGDIWKFKFRRGDKIFEVNHRFGSKEKINTYVFLPKKDATPEVLNLQKAWLKNL